MPCLSPVTLGSVDYNASLKMGDKLPLSKLSLGEADSFLENLICQTQGSGGIV